MKCVKCGTEMKIQNETILKRCWVCPNPSCNGDADEDTGVKQALAIGGAVLAGIGLLFGLGWGDGGDSA
jgi:hypothetical protein